VIRIVLLAAALSALSGRLPLDQVGRRLPPVLLTEAAPGEKEIRSLAEAWPGRIAEIGLRDGEWMLRIDDTWFAWAHGRILPEAERGRWRSYAPIPFYDYPRHLPPVPRLDQPAVQRLHERLAEARRHPPRRCEAFLSTLLRAPNRSATESRLVRIEVAGFTVTVHQSVREPLVKVSRELTFLRKTDPVVAAFLRRLAEIDGYNYRYVDGTRSRSLHSYGIAVDLIPKHRPRGYAYWRWAMQAVDDWWAIPYAQRWMPPAAVVAAFERQGFVWGGKWFFFDTMHFEYRPEILRLHSMPGPLTSLAEGAS
jgi:hypothetical protein